MLAAAEDKPESPQARRMNDDGSFEGLLATTVGEFGRYQKCLLVACLAVTMLLGINHDGYVVHSASPKHWCKVEELSRTNWTRDEIMQMSIPKEEDEKWSSCSFYDRNYTHLSDLGYYEASSLVANDTSTVPCSSWNYDKSLFMSTTATEWNLVCSSAALRPTIQGVYMAGVLSGNFIMAPISDRLGRRVAVMISLVLLIFASFASALVPSYAAFVAMRFFAGVGVMGSYANTYIILLEMVGLPQRVKIVFFYDVGVAFGIMVLSGLSYLLRDWRTLMLTIASGCSPLLLYYWVIPESPRWLLLHNRQKDAEKILRKAIKWNKMDVTDEELSSKISSLSLDKAGSSVCCNGLLGVVSLWRTPEMRSRSFKIHMAWLGIGAAAFGSTYLVTGLPISPHLAMFAYSFEAMIVRILFFKPVSKLPRRKVFAATFIGLSLSLVSSLFVPSDLPWLGFAVLLLSKMFIAVIFSTIYLYTGELFPTSIRSSAIGVGSVFARIGAILAPYIVALLSPYHSAIPGGIFAALTTCAVIMALLLPETREENLPDTIADVENWRQRKRGIAGAGSGDDAL